MSLIDSALLCAFIDVESSFNRNAFLNDRNGGSTGLTQIDLPTAQWAGYAGTAQGLANPQVNILWFVKILRNLAADLTAHDKFSLRNLAAAYNAGLGHVLGGGTDPAYEDKIIEAYTFFATALECDIPPVTVE